MMADWRALCWVYRQAALMAATMECDVASQMVSVMVGGMAALKDDEKAK